MKDGVALVANTGKALQEIVGQVVQVDSNVSAIVESSKEQATGLKEINIAVNTMDQGTQQNAAMVEETSAAAHSLAKEAERLFELIGQFKIGTHAVGQRTALVSNAPSHRAAAPQGRQKPRIVHATHGNAALKAQENWEEF